MLRCSYNLNPVLSGCVAIVVCIVCVPAEAQVTIGSDTDWLSGKSLIENQLLPVSVTWTDSPIRSQLLQFAEQRKRAIFLDRRVDPTVKLKFQFLNMTTEQIVWQTADEHGLGAARIGDLIYVGPKKVAARLPIVIQQINKNLSKMEKAKRKRWVSKSEIRWPEATTTQEISDWFAQSHGITIPSGIPTDVWPAADWPRLSTLEQLSLFLVGFDFTFNLESNGTSMKLLPFPVIKTASMKLSLRRNAKLDLETVAKKFGDLKTKRSGRSLEVSGPVDSIADLDSWMVSQQLVNSDNLIDPTFDLNVTARRGDILATVSQQTGRKLVYDTGDMPQILQDRITLSLIGASLEKLLDDCLAGTSLSYELSKTSLRIFRKVK